MKNKKSLLASLLLLTSTIAVSQVFPKFDVTYCRADWNMSPDAMHISGSVCTYFIPIGNDAKVIDFDLANNMNIDRIVGKDGVLQYTRMDNKIIVNLPNKLKEGKMDSVTIYYHGTPISTGYGSFKISNYRHTLWTLSESFGAKDWWPCRQNLYDKIDSMDIFVTCPAKYKVASNGVLVSDSPVGMGHTVHYKEHHPINHYMVGVAIGVYNVHSDKFLLKDDRIIELIDYVWPTTNYPSDNLKYTADLIDMYGSYYVPYPFMDEKYGHAQIGWSGGIEHQTMTFLYDYDPLVVAHELAHQWFGNYVTCKGWSNIWINEGFASYSEILALERFYQKDTLRWREYSMASALNSQYSIYVKDTTDMDVIFDQSTTYDKGGLVLQMLRNEIGTDAFFKGCRSILQKYANGFASIEDARQCFEAVADTSLQEFFNNWIYGIGYPIYNVTYKQNDRNEVLLTINQTTSHPSVGFYAMHPTIRIIGETQSVDVRIYNTEQGQKFTIPVDFKVVDVQFDPDKNILCKSEILKVD